MVGSPSPGPVWSLGPWEGPCRVATGLQPHHPTSSWSQALAQASLLLGVSPSPWAGSLGLSGLAQTLSPPLKEPPSYPASLCPLSFWGKPSLCLLSLSNIAHSFIHSFVHSLIHDSLSFILQTSHAPNPVPGTGRQRPASPRLTHILDHELRRVWRSLPWAKGSHWLWEGRGMGRSPPPAADFPPP